MIRTRKLLIGLFLLLLLITTVQLAKADDSSWLCTEESSQHVGNEIHSCGIGSGSDESVARLKAFDNAKAEFLRVCDSSSDCKDHKVNADPKRTTCSQGHGSSYTCHRLVVFTVLDSVNMQEVVARNWPAPKPVRRKGYFFETGRTD